MEEVKDLPSTKMDVLRFTVVGLVSSVTFTLFRKDTLKNPERFVSGWRPRIPPTMGGTASTIGSSYVTQSTDGTRGISRFRVRAFWEVLTGRLVTLELRPLSGATPVV